MLVRNSIELSDLSGRGACGVCPGSPELKAQGCLAQFRTPRSFGSLVSLAGAYRDKLSFRGGTDAKSENRNYDRTITILSSHRRSPESQAAGHVRSAEANGFTLGICRPVGRAGVPWLA